MGERIGNFSIVSQIGVGGMGEVFLGVHDTIGTKVAIKMLLPHISANKAHVQRFFNEAIAASKIQHAGIGKIFDVGFTERGRAYLVMEHLDGESLAARIRRLQRIPIASVGEIAKQMASVLDAVHKAGITHRDLKPDNVFIVPDTELDCGERVKVLDFGIAKLSNNSGLTATAAGTMGTPAYMSPEQWKNSKHVDWRADAYSLGCLVFEMVVGQPPFPAESIGEACAKHLTEQPPRLASVAAVPAALDELIARLLAKDPAQRPASMREVGQTFAALAAGASATALPAIAAASSAHVPMIVPATTTLGAAAASVEGTKPASNRRGLLIALGAVGVALAGIVVVIAIVLASPAKTQDVAAPIAAPDATAVVMAADAAAPPKNVAETVAITPQEPLDAAVVAVASPDAAIARAAPPDAASARAPRDAAVVAAAPPDSRVRMEPMHVETDVPIGALDTEGAKPACDEVSCVLDNYAGPCCAKYKKPKPPPPDAPAPLADVISRADIASGIAAIKGAAMACGEKSSAKGTVQIGVKVAPDGSVTSVAVKQAPDAALGACVAAAVRRAHFPRTTSGGSFGYPFVF